MYHRDGRFDYKRKDQHGEQGNKDGLKTTRRNRWDDKGSGSDHSSSNNLSDRRREDSTSSPNWESKKREEKDNGREFSSNSSRSRDRSRSRSRSRSPFRRSFRDCANPTKDEYKYQNDKYNHSTKQPHDLSTSSKKNASWSDSSDDDDQSGKSTSNAWALNYGSKDERKHHVPSMTATHNNMQSLISGANVGSSSSSGISLKLGGSSAKPMPLPKVISVPIVAKSSKVAAIFNAEDDDEPEEMPPECKMRMKNVGRETRTSEGPNSFGKTKIGFCNMSHLAEKRLGGGNTGAVKKP